MPRPMGKPDFGPTEFDRERTSWVDDILKHFWPMIDADPRITLYVEVGTDRDNWGLLQAWLIPRSAAARYAAENCGQGSRLPTEAEWEDACRAVTKTPLYLGEALSGKEANVKLQISRRHLAPGRSLERPRSVGGYALNKCGLYDLHGNVWEGCNDWYRTMHSEFELASLRARLGKSPC